MPCYLLDRKPFDPAVSTLTPSLMKQNWDSPEKLMSDKKLGN